MELSESGSTSVTAAALGSDTSLQEENSGGKDKSKGYFHEKNPTHSDHNYTINYNKHKGNLQSEPYTFSQWLFLKILFLYTTPVDMKCILLAFIKGVLQG